MARKTSQDAIARASTARREAMWLKAVDEYFLTPKEIAEASGLTLRRVQYGLKRARREKIDFLTAFDVEWVMNSNPFTRTYQCEWHGYQDIPKGVRQGCMFCLRAGLSHLMGRHGKPLPGEKKEPEEPKKSFAEMHHPPKSPKPSKEEAKKESEAK